MLTIIILTLGAVYEVFDIYFEFKERKRKKEGKFKNEFIDKLFYWGRYALVIALLWTAIKVFLANDREKRITAIHGTFKDLKMYANKPTLIIGGSERGIKFQNNEHDISFGEPIDPIKLTKTKGEIYLNAFIRDSKGDPIAMLFERGWEIINTEGIEYNNDETAFEIISGGRVIFQIQLSRDTVYCYGMICSEGGRCLFSDPKNGVVPLPKLQGTQRFILPTDFILPPLFKYPRFQYLGVRAND